MYHAPVLKVEQINVRFGKRTIQLYRTDLS